MWIIVLLLKIIVKVYNLVDKSFISDYEVIIIFTNFFYLSSIRIYCNKIFIQYLRATHGRSIKS
jgi:hypothetical protein